MLLINFDVGNVIRQNAKKKIFVVLQILVLCNWYMISIVLNLSSAVNTIKHQCLYNHLYFNLFILLNDSNFINVTISIILVDGIWCLSYSALNLKK